MSQQQYQSSNYKLINFNVPHYMVTILMRLLNLREFHVLQF